MTHPKNCRCDCCVGTSVVTPREIWQRPGLEAISYRIGEHGAFLETMKARLSSSEFPALQALRTRTEDDPSIALLDGWALLADVLTFYQERLANEGFLRTATERRSIRELARLVGYEPRPGVSASVFLAYTVDDNAEEPVEIPVGSRVQSVPGQDEQPASFETSEKLEARKEWNIIKPRLKRPQTVQSILHGAANDPGPRVYLNGTATNLRVNDPLLIEVSEFQRQLVRVSKVIPDNDADHTLVKLAPWTGSVAASGVSNEPPQEKLNVESLLSSIVKQLSAPRSVPPRNSQSLERRPAALFDSRSDVGIQAVASLQREAGEKLPLALANAAVSEEVPIRIHAFRKRAQLFGNTAPRKVVSVNPDTGVPTTAEWSASDVINAEEKPVLYLDSSYDSLQPESWVVVDYSAIDAGKLAPLRLPPSAPVLIAKANEVSQKLSRAEYSISGQSSRVSLKDADGNPIDWFDFEDAPSATQPTDPFQLIRRTSVLFESERLELAEEPMVEEICGGDQFIETDSLLSGLKSGRWLIVSGERSDIPGTSNITGSELVMLDAVQQYAETVEQEDASGSTAAALRETGKEGPAPFLPGDKLHTYIKLAKPLSYCYKRDTVAIYGNVVKANHGETREEVLGSGDGSASLQRFVLKQPPLTYVASPEPDGVASTLRVYVNDVEWHEQLALVASGPASRVFLTKTDDEARTSVIFGNGVNGARLPTGIENVRATYRNGIGKSGNVKAEQISQLMSRPLGVKEVVNPLPATGGADRETRDQARRNAPLTVKALDRVVSTGDYADFARTFAGIGKAAAAQIPANRTESVYVTIAGVDDIPIADSSDLYMNLGKALREFGDPYVPIDLKTRELLILSLSARIEIFQDYVWENVVDSVREALVEEFSFDRRDLGQGVPLSEIISTIHSVRGVSWADIEMLGAVSQLREDGEQRTPGEVQQELQKLLDEAQKRGQPRQFVTVRGIRLENGVVKPAQVAFFLPDIPETLILNRIQEAT